MKRNEWEEVLDSRVFESGTCSGRQKFRVGLGGVELMGPIYWATSRVGM